MTFVEKNAFAVWETKSNAFEFSCFFSAKELVWVMKPFGRRWNGNYYRNKVLQRTVILFLKNPEKVLDPPEIGATPERRRGIHVLLESFSTFFRIFRITSAIVDRLC
jgi:hypothetical protein